jgi:hypothetical protein
VRSTARAQFEVAHGLADISLTKPDRRQGAGVRRRRKPRVSQIAGSTTRARCALPGRRQPIPAKVDQRNELPAIRSNRYSYRDRAASDGQQPVLTRSSVGPFMPKKAHRIRAPVEPTRSKGCLCMSRSGGNATRSSVGGSLLITWVPGEGSAVEPDSAAIPRSRACGRRTSRSRRLA